jgi:hypothetical protein
MCSLTDGVCSKLLTGLCRNQTGHCRGSSFDNFDRDGSVDKTGQIEMERVARFRHHRSESDKAG